RHDSLGAGRKRRGAGDRAGRSIVLAGSACNVCILQFGSRKAAHRAMPSGGHPGRIGAGGSTTTMTREAAYEKDASFWQSRFRLIQPNLRLIDAEGLDVNAMMDEVADYGANAV